MLNSDRLSASTSKDQHTYSLIAFSAFVELDCIWLRSNTTNVKMNRKSDPGYAAKLWKCDGCSSLDTLCHIMWCPVYAPLREGLDENNDKDIVHYFQQVFRLRENRNSEEFED